VQVEVQVVPTPVAEEALEVIHLQDLSGLELSSSQGSSQDAYNILPDLNQLLDLPHEQEQVHEQGNVVLALLADGHHDDNNDHQAQEQDNVGFLLCLLMRIMMTTMITKPKCKIMWFLLCLLKNIRMIILTICNWVWSLYITSLMQTLILKITFKGNTTKC
jgi:hypothetical protein